MKIEIVLTEDNGEILDKGFDHAVDVPKELTAKDVADLPAQIAEYARRLLKVTLGDKMDESFLTLEEIIVARKIWRKLGLIQE